MSVETRCRFEKALISGTAECAQAKRLEIGERLVCLCRSPAAAQRCDRYLALLRQNMRFVFRQANGGNETLSNYQEICLQCGGLLGLAAMIDGAQADDKFEVSALLKTVEDEQQGIESISLDRIIPRIAAYNPRPHRKKR